jgi:nitrite reductase/ring-hydroxylating ferredoxin subunit
MTSLYALQPGDEIAITDALIEGGCGKQSVFVVSPDRIITVSGRCPHCGNHWHSSGETITLDLNSTNRAQRRARA